ncbi:TPA: hypothetical protein ACWOXJ_000403, partial [Salmonella enterica subsp. enterica]
SPIYRPATTTNAKNCTHFNGEMRPASEFDYHGVADGSACLRPSYARLLPGTPKEKPALQGPELLWLTP